MKKHTRCNSCKKILKRVKVTSRRKTHIIRRHFSSSLRARKVSRFNKTPRADFYIEAILNKLRSGEPDGKKMDRDYLRYIFEFPFSVGTTLDGRETCYVKVLFIPTECCDCGEVLPENMQTMYSY